MSGEDQPRLGASMMPKVSVDSSDDHQALTDRVEAARPSAPWTRG